MWKVALDSDDRLFEASEMDHPAFRSYMKQIQNFMQPLVAAEGPEAIDNRKVRTHGFVSINTQGFKDRFPGVSFNLEAYVEGEVENDGNTSNTASSRRTDPPRRYGAVSHEYSHRWYEAGMTLNNAGMNVAVASQSVENITGAITTILDPSTSTHVHRTQETQAWRRQEGREMDETILVPLEDHLQNLQIHDDAISRNQPRLEKINEGIIVYHRWYKANVFDENVVRRQNMQQRLRNLLRCRSQNRFDEVNIVFCFP